MVLTVSIADASGVTETYSFDSLGLYIELICLIQKPGNILSTEPNILAIAPGLFALFTKNLCSLGSAT